MKLRYFKIVLVLSGLLAVSSCKKFFDINKNPNALPSSFILYPQLLTSAQVNLGFEGGSDLFRYATEIMQQMSGEASSANQTYFYYLYNITGSDENNVWGSIYAGTLSDLELVIKQATAASSPYYSGVAKILKAYEYSLVVDTWGKVPYSEAQQLDANTQPHYDDDATIYPKLITLLGDAVNDLNTASSTLSPGTNSIFYTNATFATSKPFWIKLANTLKLRLILHYSKKDPAGMLTQFQAAVNAAGPFMTSNADNFQCPFYNVANQRSPISAFEVSRPNYLFADRFMAELMNGKSDPRRPFYFAIFPYDFAPFTTTSTASTATTISLASTTNVALGMTVSGPGIPPYTIVKAIGTGVITVNDDETPGYALPAIPNGSTITFSPAYRGPSAVKPPIAPNNNYSRIHTFLRGAITAGTVQPFTYAGAAPQRMLSFAEYCFIRSEAAVRGVTGSTAQQWFTDGITASMTEAGVSAGNITTYLAANGTLSATPATAIRQIIEEKYVALFGVSVEPWTDWRRTGWPNIPFVANHQSSVSNIPRSLFYPQSEIDLNPNCPGQKAADLQTGKPFWDN